MSIRSTFCNSKSYFQRLTILSFGLILTASLATFSLPKISVKASTGPEFIIVTYKNGVNIRDKNCNIVDQVNYGLILSYNENGNGPTLYCTVNGEKLVMSSYGTGNTNMFVASKYTEIIHRNSGTYTNQDKVRLNNPSGVNLRDDKCQRIMTLPNGTFSEQIPAGYSGGSGNICKAGGEFYYMTSFVYKGQIYQVAEILTKYE